MQPTDRRAVILAAVGHLCVIMEITTSGQLGSTFFLFLSEKLTILF